MAWKNRVRTVLNKWPGKHYFGIYRFLPLFFLMGAALEFSMIKWTVGEVNFYKTYKKKRIHELAASKFEGH